MIYVKHLTKLCASSQGDVVEMYRVRGEVGMPIAQGVLVAQFVICANECVNLTPD